MEPSMSEDPQAAILFFSVSLVIGIVCKKLLHGTKVPYTVAVFLLGIVLGYIEYGTNLGLGKLGISIRMWANINPDLILFVFLPPLLFESTFSMEAHQVKRCLAQMVLLAGPGVLISTFLIGTMIHFLFPFGWNWTTSFLLGGLLSATDPVAVVAFLKELGASKKLSTLIEGESIMNDGVSIVVFRIFFEMVLGQTLNVPKSIKYLSQVSFGAIALGLLFGLLPFVWLGFTRNDIVTELTLTFAVSYIAYFSAEDGVHVSGIITVTALGILFSSLVKLSFKGERQQIMHNFWETISYVANTLVFILSGTIIAESIHQSLIYIQGYTWGYVVLLYTFLQVSRGLVVAVLYPGLQYFGYGLDWKEAIILVWSGLRGVVALSLSLSVHHTSEGIISKELSKKDGALFVFFTGGVVFLTLIFNGTTTQLLLHLLGMQKSTIAKKQITSYTRSKMNNKVFETFQRLGEDEELGQENWPSIINYITCLNSPHGQRQTHASHLTANGDDLHLIANEEDLYRPHVQDIRLQLLAGVRAAYRNMLDDEKITQFASILLIGSVDEALDLAISHETLLDWKGLSGYVNYPDYFKYQKFWFLPMKLVTFLTVKRLELGCHICAAFLQAHSIARRQLYDFIGGSETVQVIIQESEAEGESAKQYLEDVQLTFPQVLSAVKIKQVTCSTLLELIHYVQDLEKVGLLNEIEMNELQNALEADLQKLGRNPPSIKMPQLNDILANQPLLKNLPSTVGEPLGSSAKVVMKPRGSILYNQSSEPEGLWLIANGVVKCDCTDFADRHVPNPTFTCGSTLGLYEALTGKPHLCVLTAESAVHCFFIERKKILSSIESAPETEELFWKESALVVAKLLSPQQFQGFSVEQLWDSLFEQLTMHILLRDEVIETRPLDVILLLEGFVKQMGRMTSIEAPAILTANAEHHEITLDQLEARFQAMTRSRIIIFHFNSFQQ